VNFAVADGVDDNVLSDFREELDILLWPRAVERGIDVENSVCSCDVWRWTNGELSLSGRPWSAVNESDDDDAGSV